MSLVREHCWETDWSMILMMMRRMSLPYVPGDWTKEDEVHVEVENTCDFNEEDVLKDF